MKRFSSYTRTLGNCLIHLPRHFAAYWRYSWWHKIIVAFISLCILCLGTMYGIAEWYIHSEQHKPLVLGTTFVADYAQSLGVDPHSTLTALITDLHIRNFRLVSYWSDIEQTQGRYDFSELDWEFQQIQQAHGTVSLSLGLRQPRWPECHMPAWAMNEPASAWQPQLNSFITAVVNHYKNSPALVSYQLENEYFLQGFGGCTNFDRTRLVSEYNLVKKLDPRHTLIVTRSQNALGISVGDPRPDETGLTIYRRVWDAGITHRYLEYPFPSWYYAFIGGWQKIATGRDTIIHEMQAEAWPPNGKNITEVSLAEQNKSFNAQRFQDELSFAKNTGMRTIYFWGSEYWYYRLTVLHDTSVWDTARHIYAEQ